MKICIVGTGAAGWISAFELSKFDTAEITIIGSPSIPTIGVGESTTLQFFHFLKRQFTLKEDFYKFLKETDAAIKYGVNYQGWGYNTEKFLHGFNYNYSLDNTYVLGNLDRKIDFNLTYPLANYLYDNYICEDDAIQPYSFHFDANKLIHYFEKTSKNISNIKFIKDTVIDSAFSNNEDLDFLVLSSGEKVTADYYISCIGQTAFNQKIFKEEYVSYSNILLTDKALFTPIAYKNKKQEFFPFTTAKTMKHGWRWITPTYSRIGTGYVFSSNHITEGEAIDELRNDIGDRSLEPNIVDFFPRKVKKVFKNNYCTMGMASGFMEPLDAPGINFLFLTLELLKSNLNKFIVTYYDYEKDNIILENCFNFWSSFILHQYKTCSRNDSNFWIDHKNVEFDYYNNLVDHFFNFGSSPNFDSKGVYVFEPWMFYNTTAGKGLRWPVKKLDNVDPILHVNTNENKIKDKLINHLDYFDWIHRTF